MGGGKLRERQTLGRISRLRGAALAAAVAPVVGVVALAPGVGGAATSRVAPPVLGKTVDVVPVSGRVYLSPPGRTRQLLQGARQVPVGSTLDAQHGAVQVTSATTQPAGRQSGEFRGGAFVVLQPVAEAGLTELRLTGGSFSGCARARSAAKRRLSGSVIRLLKANVQGRFRTRGRFSSATVRGTQWDTLDRCGGTETRVVRGVVVVHDLVTGRDRVLGAGQSQLVPASGSAPAVPTGAARMTQCPPGDANNPFPSNTPFTFTGVLPGAPAGTPLRIEYTDPNTGSATVVVHVTTDAGGMFTDTHTFPATTGGFTYGADAIPRYPDDPLSPGQGCSFAIR